MLLLTLTHYVAKEGGNIGCGDAGRDSLQDDGISMDGSLWGEQNQTRPEQLGSPADIGNHTLDMMGYSHIVEQVTQTALFGSRTRTDKEIRRFFLTQTK